MITSYHIIGLMSGTSLDGLDIVDCRCSILDVRSSTQNSTLMSHRASGSGRVTRCKTQNFDYEILGYETIPYSGEWQEKLRGAIHLSEEEIGKLNIEYGKHLGSIVKAFIKRTGSQAEYIASHGHTIFHQPEKHYTLQIGDGNEIAKSTGLTTVYDFRSGDVKLGGQGAPLVPIGDRLLFGEYDACLNLGGFANISFEDNEKRRAYDICPVNFVLNALSRKLGKEYDRDGTIAASHAIDEQLLQKLNALAYYQQPYPKSLGYEWVEKWIWPMLEGIDIKTAIATVTEHAAQQIGKSIPKSQLKTQNSKLKTLVSGGGARNSFLIERIKQHTKAEIIIAEDTILEYKEALIFALLGVLRLRNEINILSSVTGASRDSIGGEISHQ